MTIKSKNQHVIPHKGRWAVRSEGNERFTSVHNTQSEAVDAARDIAMKQQSELIIHRADGRVRERDSFGPDPFPPKSPREVLFPASRSVTGRRKIKKAVNEVLAHAEDPTTSALHVVPYDGNWAVRQEGKKRVSSIHGTQSEAISAARNVAKKLGSEIFIYSPNGIIRGKDSYGKDPHASRDRRH